MQYMADLSNICISTYSEDDIMFYRGLLPDMDESEIIELEGFGISKVHEIFIWKEDNGILYWKKVSLISSMMKLRLLSQRCRKDSEQKIKTKMF